MDESQILKLILLGDKDVGKTAIFNRFLMDAFHTTGPTIGTGTGTLTRTVMGINRRVVIWDTAGQERYRSITEAYFKGSHGAILVYDVTSTDTFEILPDWLTSVRSKTTPGMPVLLLGNKCDLENCVGRERADGWAAREGIESTVVSAKEGSGIEESLQKILEAMVAFQEQITTAQVSQSAVSAVDPETKPGEKGKKKHRSC
jgi:small GTP-binding protein